MTTDSPISSISRRSSAGGAFCTTRWTQVNLAKADSEEGRAALSELCAAYYEPVAVFLRCELRDPDLARDLTHEFFAQVLNGGAIGAADPDRGRFRSYLLGAVKHFLSHHREASRRLKRGGGVESVSADDEARTEVNAVADSRLPEPAAAFDRQWALTILSRALEALRAECFSQGQEAIFERLKPWLTGEASHGDQVALAAICGWSPVALKTAVYRLKKRFREMVKLQILGTLEDPGALDEEMRALYLALEH